MGKASTRARRQAASRPQPKGRSSGRQRRRAAARRRGEPDRSPLVVVLVALVGLALAVGGIVVGVSLGEEEGSGEGSGARVGADFRSLVLSPLDPGRVFAGGERRASMSTSGGRDWSEIETLRGTGARSWILSEQAVYVSSRSGLHRSTDGATTFELVNENLPDTDVQALGGSDARLYAASPSAGVFAGTVGQWEVLNAEAGRSFVGRIVVDPTDDQHLFAADALAGVAESTDGGRTWEILDTGLSEATWVSGSGSDLRLLVASGPDGAVVSRDQGETWDRLDLPEDASLVEVDLNESRLLYAGIHDGNRVELQISIDSGETWVRPDANNVPNPGA